MKALLNIVGTNEGGSFLKEYEGQMINIESLFKDIDINSPPLGILTTENKKQLSLQLIDVRFIEKNIFIHCFVIKDDDSKGGKVLMKLTPDCSWMFPEIKKVLELHDGHIFIIAIKIDEVNVNYSLDSLKTILIFDVLKDSLPPDKLKNILEEEFYLQFVSDIFLKNLQLYRNEDFLILVLKINNFLKNLENTWLYEKIQYTN